MSSCCCASSRWNGIQIFFTRTSRYRHILSTDLVASEIPTGFGILPFIAGTLGRDGRRGDHLDPAVGRPGASSWPRSRRAGRENIAQPAMEVFVGIPSVVWGWLGHHDPRPVAAPELRAVGFTSASRWFAGSLVLSLMILPTITSDRLRRHRDVVPRDMRTGSLALGTTRWQTIRHVVLPAATTGIVTAWCWA